LQAGELGELQIAPLGGHFGGQFATVEQAHSLRAGREKGSSLNSAFLTSKPPASSVYVHVLEAPSPLKRSISVRCPFPSARTSEEKRVGLSRATGQPA
jgi:hypothetical protein